MTDFALFLIGLFVFLNVASAILFVAYHDAVDRKREEGEVDSPIDETLMKIVGDE